MEPITVSVDVHAPLERAWDVYTQPEHITQWNHASDDWHSPHAENDLRVGGRFTVRMEAKDGSQGFDFAGTYTDVVPHQKIAYTMDGADARTVLVEFVEHAGVTTVTTTFAPETENPIELQREGWQSILNSYQQYTERL